jgi:hypothetical protein
MITHLILIKLQQVCICITRKTNPLQAFLILQSSYQNMWWPLHYDITSFIAASELQIYINVKKKNHEKKKTRGPWATSLTWVTLAHIEIWYALHFHLPHSTLGGPWLSSTCFFSMSESFHVKFSFSGFIALKNKI